MWTLLAIADYGCPIRVVGPEGLEPPTKAL
jgi:hypothetical protein